MILVLWFAWQPPDSTQETAQPLSLLTLECSLICKYHNIIWIPLPSRLRGTTEPTSSSACCIDTNWQFAVVERQSALSDQLPLKLLQTLAHQGIVPGESVALSLRAKPD